MIVFLALAAIIMLLRIFAHIHFRSALISFRGDAKKEIRAIEDFRKLKCTLLTRVVVDYKRVADKAVTHVPASQLVARQISAMSFLGWRYDGMMPFVTEMERAFLWMGMILAFVFPEYAFVYGVLAVVVFLFIRIVAAFFDFTGARQQLADEILIYAEREVGRFYASDTGGAVLRLKGDLTDVIERMTANLEGIVTTMSTSLADTTAQIGKTMAETTTSIGETMTSATKAVGPALASAMDEKLINMNDNLAHTLKSWENALSEAVKLQSAMNDTSDRLGQTSLRLQSSAELLSTHMQGHSSALSDQLVGLISAVDSVKDGVGLLSTRQEALVRQGEYIEKNQQALDASLQAYEASLQGLTQSLGDGLGAFIQLHGQASAQAVGDAIKGHVDRDLLRGGDGA